MLPLQQYQIKNDLYIRPIQVRDASNSECITIAIYSHATNIICQIKTFATTGNYKYTILSISIIIEKKFSHYSITKSGVPYMVMY